MRALLVLAALSTPAFADDVLHPGTPVLDPPTLVALGVALPITGDDNFNATVPCATASRARPAWHDAMPLQHVHAEVGHRVNGRAELRRLDLRSAPATTYEIELHAIDADGGVDQTLMLIATTRGRCPGDPARTRTWCSVIDAASLTDGAQRRAARRRDHARRRHVCGQFAIHASGTATDPIVIRGVAQDARDPRRRRLHRLQRARGLRQLRPHREPHDPARDARDAVPDAGATRDIVMRRVHISRRHARHRLEA